MMDIDAVRLRESEGRIKKLAATMKSPLKVEATTDRRAALDGADFIVTSFAPHRIDFWMKDIEIAGRHGVDLLMGEHGSPAGQIHALRNITIMMDVVKDVQQVCPNAWVMNFTNPMSMMCTYLYKHTSVRAQGFCHQVHGSFGVVTEMLGMEPGDLQVVTAGINHMNFLLDIRRKGSPESFMEKFIELVLESPYWKTNQKNIPEQVFTRDFLETFGIYPVGYDNHITEYMPFFYSKPEWEKLGYRPTWETLLELRDYQEPRDATGTLDDVEPERILGKGIFPFPKDAGIDYYKETPVTVMEALLSSEPQYLDAMIVLNNGCVPNLPHDAVVDIPAVIAGGKVRGVAVGELPAFAAELCRRQIAIHDMVAQAAVSGDRVLLLEAMCLDPFVHSLTTARALVDDYLNEYKKYVPQFFA